MIKAGEQLTYPDGKPYCKCIKDFNASDLMMDLLHHLGEYEDGSPPVLPTTLISTVPFIRRDGRGFAFCVNGEWR